MEKDIVFHGIGICKDGTIYCSDGKDDIKACWRGIREISDAILNVQLESVQDKESYDNAVLAVERFRSWDENINMRNRNKQVSAKALNDFFFPAFMYVYRNGCI